MKLEFKPDFRYFLLFCLITVLYVSLLILNGKTVYAHIFLDTPNIIVKDIDNYKIVLLPFPNKPVVNETVNLNFNIQENKTDLNGVFSSISIMNNKTKQLIYNSTYKFYEFSDFTIPFIFKEAGNYVLSLDTKIRWDPKFSKKPMVAKFDIIASENKKNVENIVRISMYIGIIMISIAIIVIIKKFLIKRN